jgi:ABC-type uncharacterized transport system involved in gliding motility auxiliary subunit
VFKKLKNINLIKLLRLEKLKKPTIILLAIAVFVGINILVSFLSIRLDFSYGSSYTLSNSTKKILQKLDNGVTIKLFASSDLPTRLIPVKNDVVDLLNEYKRNNIGKMTVKILDPKKDQNAAKDAETAGIPQMQFSQMESNKYAVTASYFGIEVDYKDQKEILPQVTDVESLEYNLTAMVYKLTRKEVIKIGILGKPESYDPQTDDLGTVKQIFGKQFEIGYIDLTTPSTGSVQANASVKEIDSSYKTVLLFDTDKKEYSDDEIVAIKKYLDNKGKVIAFVDGVWVGEALNVAPANHNLFSLLKEYGINIQKNLVLSTSAELVNFGNSQVQFLSPYPFWLKTNFFDSKASYFSNVNQLTFPWVSSLSIEKANGWQSRELVKSTARSWEQKEATGSAFILDPQSIPEPKQSDLKSFALIAESKSNQGGVLLVIPSSRFVLSQFLSRTSDNLGFVLNIVNDYASGGALSGIHQRAVSFYPLPDLTDNEKDIFKYANILILPVLFGLLGGILLFKRR